MKPHRPSTTNQDLFQTLMQFHREIAVPEMQLMIDKQSEVMNARFYRVYTLFDGLYSRFDRLESEMTALKGGLVRLEARLSDVEARLTNVESRLTNVEARLTDVEFRLTSVECRLTTVESRLESVESRLSSVESELQFVKDEIGRFERWRDAVEARFDASEQNAARDAKIAEINEQIETMNARIAALETRH